MIRNAYLSVTCDITSAADIRFLIAKPQPAFGRADVLVKASRHHRYRSPVTPRPTHGVSRKVMAVDLARARWS